jgi:hypothetical protein
MKTLWGSGCIDPGILDFGTSRRWVVSFTPRTLYSEGKDTRYQLDRRLVEPRNRSWRHEEEKILAPTGTRTPFLSHPAYNQSLYQLLYPGSPGLYPVLSCIGAKYFTTYYRQQKMCKLWNLKIDFLELAGYENQWLFEKTIWTLRTWLLCHSSSIVCLPEVR